MTLRRSLWLLYTAFIVYGATIPFHFDPDHARVAERWNHTTLDPRQAVSTPGGYSIPDVVQNVLLFLPFGVLGFLAPTSIRPGRRTLFVVSLGIVLSVAIEGAQLLTIDRDASVVDVMTNTAGAFAGAVAAWQFRDLGRVAMQRLREEGLADVPELRPLFIAAMVLAIAYWQPFDVTLEVGTTVAKMRSLQRDLWQFTGLRDEGTSIMLSVFFATTLASYLSVLGEKRVPIKTIAMGTSVVLALEGSQIIIGSRMPALWDALVGTVGIMIGTAIWAGAAVVEWPLLWLGIILGSTGLSAGLQMLSPFVWSSSYHSMGWFPFFGYYEHTTFETLSHVFELLLLYIPLGFFVGRLGRSATRAVVGAIALALTVAAPVEYLQGWIVGRYPDVTDIALSLVGAWIGAGAATLSRT